MSHPVPPPPPPRPRSVSGPPPPPPRGAGDPPPPPPRTTTAPSSSAVGPRRSFLSRLHPTVSTWVVGASAVAVALIFLAVAGARGLVIAIACVAVLTGLYAFIFRRRSWALLPSRRVAAFVIGGSLVLFVVGGIIPAPHRAIPVDAATSGIGSTASADPSPTPSSHPTATPTASPLPGSGTNPATTSATALLAMLPIRPALTIAGYNRTGDFGQAWLDEDHNDCDTRNDILARDLTSITKSGACKVLTGVLVSPYTGATIHFVRGETTSAIVQIDHLVALGDAWETGAQNLSQARREQLANDPLELLAVDGKSNDEKSDKDASEWLPPNASFDCTYVARQISVKVAYSLWVTQPEHDAMAHVLATCGSITGSASAFAAASASATTTTPVATTTATTAPVVAPAPAVVAPAPAAPAPTLIVHPSAFCAKADAGMHGVTSSGTSMVCETSPTDSRLRWRSG